MPTDSTVYVVDDHLGVLRATTSLLEAAGLNVKCFASAEKFLEEYQTSRQGCLLLDVRLPGMSGIELQQKLNSESSTLPIILMSGHANNEVRDLGMANGAIAVLEKPVNARRLIEVVKNAL